MEQLCTLQVSLRAQGLAGRVPGLGHVFTLREQGEVNGSLQSHNKYFFRSISVSIALVETRVSFGWS